MKTFYLFFSFLCISFYSHAQAGAIDTSFHPRDTAFDPGTNILFGVNTTAVQADGKVIVGGMADFMGTTPNLLRLNKDGSLDAAFNAGTGTDNNIQAIAIQPDGKIIIAGDFTDYNGSPVQSIARLNTDGTLDGSFDPGTGASSVIMNIILQTDGKIIIEGGFTTFNGTTRNKLARLNADGSLDGTFDPGTGPDFPAHTMSIQADGKLIIAGNFTSYNGTSVGKVARLNTDGSLDPGFNPGTGVGGVVYGSAIQPDGKILLVGSFSGYNGTSRKNITRVNTDGSLDATFNPGTGPNANLANIGFQKDGRILVAGYFSTFNGTFINRLARLNADGSLDNSFKSGTGPDGDISSLQVLENGKIVMVGQFANYNGVTSQCAARLNADGSIGASPAANDIVRTIVTQTDGKIIVGGDFTTYNGTLQNHLVRVLADGSLDPGFDAGGGTDLRIYTAVVQPDGKILVGGYFTSYDGNSANGIARLNADGSIDPSFTPGTGVDQAIRTIALQPDGKILIGGEFTSYNGTVINRVARLNVDGTLDGTFNPGTGTSSAVRSFIVNSDGTIIMAGSFGTYNGVTVNRIVRLQANGTRDATFNAGTGANAPIYSTALQSDGKIIVSGNFTSFNGTAISKVARLSASGSLDLTYNTGTGSNGNVYAMAIQGDDKIMIGGPFSSYEGTARNGIARLQTDGSPDLSFDPGTAPNDTVFVTAVQADGKILIGGRFTGYNGTTSNRLVRVLASDITLPVSLLNISGYKKGSVNELQWTTASENNNHGFEVQRSEDGVHYNTLTFVASKAVNGNSSEILQYSYTDNQPTGARQYYRLRQADLDGHIHYSRIILVKGEMPSAMQVEDVYPNPATSIIHVRITAPRTEKLLLTITDLSGRKRAQQTVSVGSGSNTIPVRVGGLGGGTYLLQVTGSTGLSVPVKITVIGR